MTPYFRLCQKTVTHNAAVVSAVVHEAGKVWAPVLSRFLPNEVLQVILQWTEHTSCTSIEDAACLIELGFRSVLITRPMVRPDALLQLPTLAMRAKVTVVIDHFRHAELLSQALLESGASAGVLIEVDLGRRMMGVRPGPDSVLLASAVAQLPNLQLEGVHVVDQFGETGVSRGSIPLPFEESIAVAVHCQKMIEARGILCAQIVSGRVPIPSVASQMSVTTVTTSPFAVQHELANGDLSASGHDQTPALSLVCRVLSRPSLEWCVIDAGHLFWDDAASLEIVKPTGGRMLHALPDIATLLLSGESLDLRIGDEVILTHRDFSSRLPLVASHSVVIL